MPWVPVLGFVSADLLPNAAVQQLLIPAILLMLIKTCLADERGSPRCKPQVWMLGVIPNDMLLFRLLTGYVCCIRGSSSLTGRIRGLPSQKSCFHFASNISSAHAAMRVTWLQLKGAYKHKTAALSPRAAVP